MIAEAAELSVDSEDRIRSELYGLLGHVLFTAPDKPTLDTLGQLSGDSSDMGRAFDELAALAGKTTVEQAGAEYQALFIGLGRGELLPYGSYYLTGFLNEKPLAKLRNAMRGLGIARQDNVREPEDHIGSLMEMMGGLISGRYGRPATLATQREFFMDHVEPWAGHFFRDLEAAQSSQLYRPVGSIGRLFVEIERDAYSME